MDKVNYIVIKDSRNEHPFISEYIKKQKNTNDRLIVGSLCIAAGLLLLNKIVANLNERIEELGNEVKELKQMRGE